MSLRIDRAHIDPVYAHELDVSRDYSAVRRTRNRSAKLCINENKRGTHGLATHGVRCERCALVHRRGAASARATFEYHHFTPARKTS